MKNISKNWSKNEVCALFELVENYKKDNRPLLYAFDEFAVATNRQKHSVRNFYYAKLREFEENPNNAQEFGINLTAHQKSEQKFFSATEANLSIEKINKLLKKGYSVRKACMEIAGGDIKEMLRLQNKYHSTNAQNKPLQFKKSEIISNDNTALPHKNNLSYMRPQNMQNGLTNDEINSLFIGLINIVRKKIQAEVGKEFQGKLQEANIELRHSIKKIATKEREVQKLRKNFELISSEKAKLTEEVQFLRSQTIELMQFSQNTPKDKKFSELKDYMNRISKLKEETLQR